MESYRQLEKLFNKLYYLSHLESLADWDMNVMMPPKGEEARGEAMATISGVMHEMITVPQTKTWLDDATANATGLTPLQQANLREMTRRWRQANILPGEFVERKARLTTRAHSVWKESRRTNNFALFQPVLQELVDTAREEGRYLSSGSSMSPYEALLNQYEPDIRVERLDELFANVRSWLPDLLRRIVETRQPMDASVVPMQPPFPVERQRELSLALMRVWQFDFDAGRLDVSAHPFTGMTKEDCRITTTYATEDYTTSMYGTIHETGHAKYETNCGFPAMRGQPVDHARSLGIHESQSLFAEFQIGHSAAFAEFVTPLLIEHLGPQPAFTVDNVRNMHNRVKPGYIRVEADEVCYTLHVILRYEIERALIEGSMEAADVPRVWNEKMQEYLGLETLGRDDVGCLQDIHWSMGTMGYFPTYSLGAMTAAQLMASIRRELGSETVDKYIRAGNLQPILDKQAEKIWSHGCFYSTEDLIVKATGEPLNPNFLREHLERRYLHNAD